MALEPSRIEFSDWALGFKLANVRDHKTQRKIVGNHDGNGVVHDRSRCAVCKNQRAIKIPSYLIDQLIAGNVIIFAGAGVSTESRMVYPTTFYEDVHELLGLSEQDKPPFPTLMSRYCERPDGRRDLFEKFRSRLAYIDGFPELYRLATQFHKELSTLFYIDTYVTTNWDDYFEQECGATPFVTAPDFAFWNTKGRKVFKLHGSVRSFGSIIATEDDYRRAHRQLQRGALGAALKLMLATKTIVYVGYSFSDPDFLSIHRYISHELEAFSPVAYIVSLDTAAEDRFKALGLTPLFTDASHFVRLLKEHIESDGHLLSDKRLEAIPFALARAMAEHRRLHQSFNAVANPMIVYCAAYQDGLIHAFERILARAKAGEYSHKCAIAEQMRMYDLIRSQKKQKGSYVDFAYVEGYMNGLLYLVADDQTRSHLPWYFVYGVSDQPTTLTKYRKVLASGKENKRTMRLAERIVREQLGSGDELHHRPFLNWKIEAG